MSIQYASIYCITLLFTIILVRYNFYLSKKCWILFVLAGMWGGKWIIASLFTDNNTIDNAISQISYRMTAEEESSHPLTVTYVLRQVLMHLNNKPMKIFVLMFALIVLLSLLCQKRIVVISKNIIPMLLIALYPFAWYILVRNHSATHSRLEQRELAVTIMALVFSVLINLKPKALSHHISK